jgi:3D (Asp-Asp-Asp) domain-containing protein
VGQVRKVKSKQTPKQPAVLHRRAVKQVKEAEMKKRYIIACISFIIIFPIFCIITVYKEEMAALPTTETATEIVSETEQETETQPITEEWIATGYCPCEKCCGKWAKNRPQGVVKGAGGYELIQGKSMASALAYGTVVKMTGADGYNGLYVCHDRPADFVIERYQGKIIDVYFNSHAQAVEFGKRQVQVEIVEVAP